MSLRVINRFRDVYIFYPLLTFGSRIGQGKDKEKRSIRIKFDNPTTRVYKYKRTMIAFNRCVPPPNTDPDHCCLIPALCIDVCDAHQPCRRTFIRQTAISVYIYSAKPLRYGMLWIFLDGSSRSLFSPPVGNVMISLALRRLRLH